MWPWQMKMHTGKLAMRWCLNFKLKAQPTSMWGVFVHGQEKSLQREWVWAARWAEGWVEWWAEGRGHFGESVYEKASHHIFSEQFSFVNMTKSQELIQNPWFQMNGWSKCASGCGQWGRSEWVKVKTVLHLPPPTPPSPPTHFRHNMYLRLYLSQQDLTIAVGTIATSHCCVQVVFCGKWNQVCKFPGKPTGRVSGGTKPNLQYCLHTEASLGG